VSLENLEIALPEKKKGLLATYNIENIGHDHRFGH
jgi:hypothetical protein